MEKDQSLESCLRAWRSILQAEAVLSGEAIRPYHENCLGLERDILAVLRPASEEEVVALVRVAAQYRVPLYSFSTGKNWGYGSALPVADGCALVDLSRMNRIRDFDHELGLITLEPGVTQGQLYAYLREHHLDYYVPTTGAGPTTSIVGNALERGFGLTPMEDHFQAVTSLRAVLADGRVYASNFTEMGAAHAGLWKWGLGPYVDGLFAQGNHGIVTAMQISLIKRAEHVEIYAVFPKKNTGIQHLVQASKALLGDVRGSSHGIKFLNQFQLECAQGTEGIPMDTVPAHFANIWLGFGVYRGRHSTARATRRDVRRRFGPHGRVVFMTFRRYRLLLPLAKLLPGSFGAALVRKLENAKYVLDIADGVPRSDALRLVYAYETPSVFPPQHPVQDGVGVIWYAPVLPMKVESLKAMLESIHATLQKHGFPPLISFTTVNEKCAIGVIPVLYKKSEGSERAHACYQELVTQGIAQGCPPYRVHVGMMESLTSNPDSVYWQMVAAVKSALDPLHILSPGRYCPLPKP